MTTPRRRREAALGRLPDLLELVVIAIRAGATPVAAWQLAGESAPPELRPTLDELAHRLHRGARLADALTAFGEALGDEAVAFVAALVNADRYGLPLGPVLDRVTDDIRLERRRHAERDARALPVKLAFPLVGCTLPAFVLLAIAPALLGAVSTLRGNAP